MSQPLTTRGAWRAAACAVTVAAALASPAGQAIAQTAPAPGAPAAASLGERAASAADARDKQAPVLRKAEDTRALELRPELKPTPLLKLPLGRRDKLPDTKTKTPPAIDDGVARCLAQDTRSLRRECLMARPG